MPAPTPVFELRHLRQFLAVVEELHFGRAAKRLHIAQPSLSKSIRRLEDELGVVLLERTSRAVSLSEAGRSFAEGAREVLSRLDRAVAEARQASGVGQIRVGCVPNLPIAVVQRVLHGLSERDPGWRAELVNLLSLEQVRRLRAGRLELGMLYGGGPYEGVRVERLARGERILAALPACHPLAVRTRLGPDDLRGERLVMFPRVVNPPLHDWLLAQLDDAGYRFSAVTEASAADRRNLVLAIVMGGGISLGPYGQADDDTPDGMIVLRPLSPPLSMPDWVLAWPADPPRWLRPMIRVARSLARELYREHAPADAVAADAATEARDAVRLGQRSAHRPQ